MAAALHEQFASLQNGCEAELEVCPLTLKFSSLSLPYACCAALHLCRDKGDAAMFDLHLAFAGFPKHKDPHFTS